MARKPKEPATSSTPDAPEKVGTEGVKQAGILAALAMEGGDVWQKFVVYTCYGLIVIAIIALIVPPYQTAKQLIISGGAVVLLFGAMIFVIKRYRALTGQEQQPQIPLPAAPGPQNIPLSAVVHEKIQSTLEEARVTVRDFLRTTQPALNDDQVRANIFFPEYANSTDWNNYILKIRPGLHLKMQRYDELQIELQPGQGLTGNVFNAGESTVALRLPASTGMGGWDAKYHIIPKLAQIIHPDLQWIVSIPIKGADGKPIGVMNIDGLVHRFDIDTLYQCPKQLLHFPFILNGLITGK
jgi:hypothetical protein